MAVGMLSGCGAPKEEAKTGTDGGQTEISFSTWLNKDEDTPVVEGFMKENPNIKVNTEVMDGTKYPDLLQPRLMSGDAPDVMLIMSEMYDKYILEDWLMDISDLPVAETMKANKNINDIFAKDGKFYAVPITGGYSVHPIYYNKKIFDNLGLSVPQTKEEFYQACETIKAAGIDPITFGAADSWTVGSLCNPMANAAQYKYGVKYDEKLVDGSLKYSEIYGDTFKFLEDMVQKGYIGKNALTMKYEQSMQYFADGKAAMVAQGLWVPDLPEIVAADPAVFELGTFVNPLLATADNGKVRVKVSPDRILVISKTAKNQEACKKFVEYFTKDAVMEEYLNRQNLDTMFTQLKLEKPAVFENFYNTLKDETKYELISGSETYTMPKAVSSAVGESYQNLLSGSSAEKELNRLDQIFEENRDKVVKK